MKKQENGHPFVNKLIIRGSVMRLWSLVGIVSLIVLVISPQMMVNYPIPVDCRSAYHEPTIADAPIVQKFGHFQHVGVDYSVPVGSEVYAVMDGIVITVYQDSRVYGRSVYLLHCDGYMSLYAHLSETRVIFGQVVKTGQLLGLSGGDPLDNIDGDGWSSGAHLHYEIRVPGHLESNLYNIDPAKYVDIVARYHLKPVWDLDRYEPNECFMKG